MILVLVESDPDGTLSVLSQEALTFARALAGTAGLDAPTDVQALVVGEVSDAAVEQAGRFGAAVVHQAQHEGLAAFSAAAHAACTVDAVRSLEPRVLMTAASPRGNEVLAHVAARSDARMAANVTAVLSADTSGGSAELLVHRQVMGGSALEELDLTGAPALFSMAGHAVEPAPAPEPAAAELRPFAPSSVTGADLVTAVRRTVPAAGGGGDLTKARVVVGGGRGVGGPDSFDDLIALADRLGGVLGVSRVVTSLGWRPHHEQVGQTGSRITPDIYIPCGISGAIQHWAGCSSAKRILAVNTDEESPMVTRADFAVIGDLHEVVPAVSAELDARR